MLSADCLDLNTPVVGMSTGQPAQGFVSSMDKDGQEHLDDIADAIAVATSKIGLMPGCAFQGRVMQLAQLNTAHRTVSSFFTFKSV